MTNDLEDCPQETVSVVQLANPFDKEVDLNDYSIEFFGQEINLRDLDIPNGGKLEPSTYDNPVTLILYSISDSEDTTIKDATLNPTEDQHIFGDDWLDFLDIIESDGVNYHPEDTLKVQVPNQSIGEETDGWSTKRGVYDTKIAGNQNSVALYRFDDFDEPPGEPRRHRVLIDRLDIADPDEASSNRFDDRVVVEMKEEWDMLLMDDHPIDHPDQERSGYITLMGQYITNVENPADKRIPVFNDEDRMTAALFVQWDRATRAWGVDTPNPDADDTWHNDEIDSWEENPRYVFAAHDFVRSDGSLKVTNYDKKDEWGDRFEQMKHTAAFNWTEFVDPDDKNGDGNPDDPLLKPDGDPNDPDENLLPDFPDPWFSVEVWSPRAGDNLRPGGVEAGEVTGGPRDRKPTYFDMNMHEDPSYPLWSYPDKGWYGQRTDLDGDMSTSDTPAFQDGQIDGVPKGDGVLDYDEIDMTLNFPMQMLQKDGDFEQVGELLNVWLFGHLVEGDYYTTVPGDYLRTMPSPLDYAPDSFETTYVDAGTITTFSEFMYPDEDDWWAQWVAPIGEVVLDNRVNRLRFQSGENDLPMMLDGRSANVNEIVYSLDHPWPRLSVATRILDSFVCDGPGNPNPSVVLTEEQSYWHSFYNANAFSGKATPGLININTAPVEVLRTLPHMYKMVHPTGSFDTDDINPRTMIPEAMIQWREQAIGSTKVDEDGDGIYDYIEPNVLYDVGNIVGPDYSNRTNTTNLTYGNGPKHTRGFSSPAEIGMLNQAGVFNQLNGEDIVEPWHIQGNHQAIIQQDAWRIDFAALDPYAGLINSKGDPIIGAPLGIETTAYDEVSFDSEEQNLLQSGISNLITTSSDMFTVYMRIRTFKRNPIDGSWDATDLDYIVDDSRYVMLVDRSNVNSPADKPKILYFEKLPN